MNLKCKLSWNNEFKTTFLSYRLITEWKEHRKAVFLYLETSDSMILSSGTKYRTMLILLSFFMFIELNIVEPFSGLSHKEK